MKEKLLVDVIWVGLHVAVIAFALEVRALKHTALEIVQLATD
ncbi:MAG: hypothetical protein O2880_13745 [Proteobacteria bacterium]|nr:hypothetical protein [Pseudomonadota bacterium]